MWVIHPRSEPAWARAGAQPSLAAKLELLTTEKDPNLTPDKSKCPQCGGGMGVVQASVFFFKSFLVILTFCCCLLFSL